MKTRKIFILKLGMLTLSMLLITSCTKEIIDLDSEATESTEGFERIPSLNVVLPDYVTDENSSEFLTKASVAELIKYQNAYIIIDYLTQLDKIDTVAAQEKEEILDWQLSQYLNETELQGLNALLISDSEISERACIRRIYERVCETRKTTCYRSVPVRYTYPHPLAPRIKYYRRVPYSCYKTSCRNKLIRIESC
ncbi:hypothetical protein N9954_03525 [Maribacter sp.]|nr:hypothetical protein [Maribacter sp.]